jgi:glutamyl-tRNA synthetase
VLGPDGTRLAKRHGAVTLADRAALGQDAADVRSDLAASVGLAEPGERPSPAELVERFDPERLRAVAA